jgi:alkylation response protein AidB-like acyl-CoA dehydrogenase
MEHRMSTTAGSGQTATKQEIVDRIRGLVPSFQKCAEAAEKARRIPGYRVSGQSPFASGVGHSQWVLVGGMVDAGGEPEWTFFLIPPGEYKVADTWFTVGMRGTGSNTIVTENVFVPKSRTLRLSNLREGKGPGGAPCMRLTH